jgi:soluble lytic murein transglycosylase
MLRTTLFLAVALAGSTPVVAQTTAQDPLAGPRAAFALALNAVPGGNPAYEDSDLLRSYPLYPWLEAERLKFQLARADRDGSEPPDAAIAAFLTRDGDAPWTRDLRAAWLKTLASQRRWPEFLGFYLESRADTALRCNASVASIQTGPSAALVAPALAIWNTGSELPAACTPMIDWLTQQGAIGPQQIAERTRLALEAQKLAVARMLIRQLPEEQRGPYQLWADVLDNPARHLERGLAQGVEPRGAIDGFSKLARSNADDAALTAARIEASGVPTRAPATVGDMRREIALNLAWSRRPESVGMFRQVPEAALDERAHEWRVRAALWAGDWALAAAWIARMPPALLDQPRWRYWRARANDKLDRDDVADAEYERLAQENGYYAVLASERLKRGYAPRTQVRPGNAAARALIDASPGFVRAREAWRVEQLAWARSEWNEATRNFDPAHLLEAARVASGWGWHLQAVATSSRAEVFDDFGLLYPRPYARELHGAAKRVQLPAEWVWGVLRQESLYDPRARSSANALGLLQLLPATARAVARRNDFDTPSEQDLFDPQTNLLLGTTYLREQFDRFGGRFVLVLGAYNAGPNAVKRWLPEAPLETDVWIENVPFNETRNYIQRIVWHSTVFGWESSGNKPQRITSWMTPISADLPPVKDS